MRFLAVTMGVGGVARVVSMADRGKPHWFPTALTAVEFVIPAVFLPIAAADERARTAAAVTARHAPLVLPETPTA